MAWIITKDVLSAGTEYDRTGKARGIIAGGQPTERFRLLDDDAEPYYYGRRTNEDDTCLDWAMNDSGCTMLEVWERGKWVTSIA